MRYGLVNKFIDHLYRPFGTTCNYSAIANLHTLQNITAVAKHFSGSCVFFSRSLATASNSRDSSASRSRVLSSEAPMQNSTHNWQLSTNWLGPRLAAISHKLPSHLHWLTFNWQLTGSKVKVTLRLAVCRQSIHLGVRPLETHDQRFFQLNSCGNSPYVTFSLTRRWVCLFWHSLRRPHCLQDISSARTT
jgi:hypothetical protein